MQDVASIRRAAASQWRANVPKLTNLAGGPLASADKTRGRRARRTGFVHHGQARRPESRRFFARHRRAGPGRFSYSDSAKAHGHRQRLTRHALSRARARRYAPAPAGSCTARPAHARSRQEGAATMALRSTRGLHPEHRRPRSRDLPVRREGRRLRQPPHDQALAQLHRHDLRARRASPSTKTS